MFRLLSGVLLMGNVKFVEGDRDTQKAADGGLVAKIAELFKVGSQQLESARVPPSCNQACRPHARSPARPPTRPPFTSRGLKLPR